MTTDRETNPSLAELLEQLLGPHTGERKLAQNQHPTRRPSKRQWLHLHGLPPDTDLAQMVADMSPDLANLPDASVDTEPPAVDISPGVDTP